ncbi:hypothetical protein ABTL66_19215, partial [Acinetobacter baumannii]
GFMIPSRACGRSGAPIFFMRDLSALPQGLSFAWGCFLRFMRGVLRQTLREAQGRLPLCSAVAAVDRLIDLI